MLKKGKNRTTKLFSDGFELRPLLLDGIEIGTVGREEKKRVSGIRESLFRIHAFVECCVVENNDTVWRELGDQTLRNPRMEYVGIDVACKQMRR